MQLAPLFIDLESTSLSEEEKEILAHPLVGGLILFTRNYESLAQLKQLIADCRSVQRTTPLIITIDHEGGRVQRFRENFTNLPCAKTFGDLYDKDPARGLALAHAAGWVMASELLALGIDLSFAPVVDLQHNVSSIIGDRSFHHTPKGVIKLTSAFIAGMQEAGMVAVGKHYPGHGGVVEDSHLSLPVDTRSLEELCEQDLLPFTYLISQGILTGLMSAHIIYSAIDDKPATYSSYWLKDLLRNKWGFKGIVFSDDLSMQGACQIEDEVERAQAALQAGCDALLVCNHRPMVKKLLAKLPTHVSEVPDLFGRFDPSFNLQNTEKWQHYTKQLSDLNTTQ